MTAFQYRQRLASWLKEKGEVSISDFVSQLETPPQVYELSTAIRWLTKDERVFIFKDGDDLRLEVEEQAEEEWSVDLHTYYRNGWGPTERISLMAKSYDDFVGQLISLGEEIDLTGLKRDDGCGVEASAYGIAPELRERMSEVDSFEHFEYVVVVAGGETTRMFIAVPTFGLLMALVRELDPFIRLMVEAYERREWRVDLLRAAYDEQAEPFLESLQQEREETDRTFFAADLRRIVESLKDGDGAPFD